MGPEIFVQEERILMNNICKNENLAKLAKKDVENSLIFSRHIADEEDVLVTDLLDNTLSKIRSITENQWNEMKMQIPFPVNV